MEIILTDYFIKVGTEKLIFLVISFLILFIINLVMLVKVIKNESK